MGLFSYFLSEFSIIWLFERLILFKVCLLIWLPWPCCIMWDLVPWPMMKHGLPTFGVLSLPAPLGSLKTVLILAFLSLSNVFQLIKQNLSIQISSSLIRMQHCCTFPFIPSSLLRLRMSKIKYISTCFALSVEKRHSPLPHDPVFLPSFSLGECCLLALLTASREESYFKSWLAHSFFQILTTRQQSLTINGNNSFRWNWIEYSFSSFLSWPNFFFTFLEFHYGHAVHSLLLEI